jgi:hypothetical protein
MSGSVVWYGFDMHIEMAFSYPMLVINTWKYKVPRDDLSARHAALLCHGSVLLLEPVAQSLGGLHVLVDAPHDAALLARGERLALEAVDARVEALLDEVRVHLQAGRLARRRVTGAGRVRGGLHS